MRNQRLKSPMEAAAKHSNSPPHTRGGGGGDGLTPSITDIRRQIEGQINDQRRMEMYGPNIPTNNNNTKNNSKLSKKEQEKEQKKSETNALHRIEFMRKIEEGKINLEGGGNQQSACVFQQLDLNKGLLKDFADMDLSPIDFGNTAMGKRNANTRRIVIPLATSDRNKTSDATTKKSVSAEYAARYCEMLNVTPTARHLAMIQKMIPLKSCTVSQLYNAGQARNNIVIEPSRVDVKIQERDTTDDIVYRLLSTETTMAPSSSSGKNNNNGGARSGSPTTAATAAGSSSSPSIPTTQNRITQNAATFMRTVKNTNVTNLQELTRFPSFEDYKYRFIFPWNLDTRDISGQKAMMAAAKNNTAATNTANKIRSGNSSSAPPTPIPRTNNNSNNIDIRRSSAAASDSPTPPPQHNDAIDQLDLLDQLLAKGAAIARGEKVVDADSPATTTRSTVTATTTHTAAMTTNNDDSMPRRNSNGVVDAAATTTTTPRSRGASSSNEHNPSSSNRHIGSAGAIVFSDKDAVNSGIYKELTSPIIPSDTPEMQSYLRQFTSGFPWEKLVDRLPPAVISTIQRFIRSPPMVTVCMQLCELMYCSYVRPYSDAVSPMTTTQLEDLFLRIAASLSSVVRTSDGIEHALRLLAIRVVVLAELQSHLPLFATCDIGEGVKKSIDMIITGIGDPTGLICRICVFESSPQALRMIRQKRLPKLNISSVRSPLSFLLMDRGGASGASEVPPEFAAEIAELQRFVSPRIRQQLLSIIRTAYVN